MKKGFLKSLADSRKIKYSTLSVAFTAIVIALVVIVNSITSVLGNKFGWYFDMTDEQIFSLSDDAKKILSELDKSVNIEIIFPYEEDEINTDYANTSDAGAVGYIHNTAKQIQKECPNITISYHSIDDLPFYASLGVVNNDGSGMKEGHILIMKKDANGEYIKGDYRLYSENYFFIGDTDGNLYGYNGELMFISAISAMTRVATPVVYFTTKHGEKTIENDEDGYKVTYLNINEAASSGYINYEAYELMKIFVESGFEIKSVDLMTEEIPSDAKILVINQPTADFDYDELRKVESYVDKQGIVFCFTSHEANLPNLYTKMEADYGIKVNNSGEPIYDESTKFGQKQYSLLGNIAKTTDFAAKRYFPDLVDNSSSRARFSSSAWLDIDKKYMSQNGFDTGGDYLKYTFPLVETTNKATDDGKKGTYTLMSITSIDHYKIEDQFSRYSYFVACPCADFVSNANLASDAAINRDIIYSLIKTTSTVQTPVNIDGNLFMTYELDITDNQAQGATIALATIIPVIIALVGIAIIIRRKHR